MLTPGWRTALAPKAWARERDPPDRDRRAKLSYPIQVRQVDLTLQGGSLPRRSRERGEERAPKAHREAEEEKGGRWEEEE